VIVSDIGKGPDWYNQEGIDRLGVRSFVGVPLLLRSRVVGVLHCFTTQPREFQSDEIELLRDFADQAAVALENARLLQESEKRTTNLEVLSEIAKAVNATLDLQELFRVTVEQVKRVIPCERCSVYKVEPDKQVISRIYAVDDVEERVNRIPPSSLKGSEFEHVLETHKARYIPDTRKNPHPRIQLIAAEGLRSIIQIPILGEGECIGFLNICSSKADGFATEQINLLGSVADHLAPAMKNAELYAQAKESGERLESFVRGALDGIITVDLEGRITSWNPSAEAIYGFSESEVVGQDFLTILPDAKGDFEEIRARFRAGETIPPIETVRRRKDGSLVDLSVTVSPVRDSSGNFVGVSGINRDITERKRAEDALRESEAKGRTLLAAVPDLLLRIKGDGTFLECKGAENFDTYVPPDQFLGKNVRDILPADTGERIIAKIQNALQTGKAQVFEYPPLENGETRNYESRIVVSGQDDVLALVRDITERKRAEDALRESEARNRAILQAAPDGILTFDENGVIDSFNPAAERIFGLSAPEVLDGKIGALMDGDDAPRFEAYLQWYLQTGENDVFSLSWEIIGRRKDGATFPMNMTVSEMRLGGRRIFTGIIRDLTAHKTIENRIHQAERMESTGILARGIAHDFGNLLTSIQANLMLAMTEMKPADPGFFISPASARPPTGPPSLSPGSARWAGISPFKSGGSI
jgi:PAS domain S-box-containing protein